MENCRRLGRLVPEALQHSRSLSRAPPQDRVDESGGVRAGLLRKLDVLVHGRIVGGATQIQKLEQPESQDGQHGRIEPLERPGEERRGDLVERCPPLHRPVAEGHGERPVALVELGRLGVQRAIGVRALLEHAADHPQGAARAPARCAARRGWRALRARLAPPP